MRRILAAYLTVAVLVGLVFAPVVLLAATGTSAVETPHTWSGIAVFTINAMVPVVCMLVVAGVQWLLPKIPAVFLLLLAPALGPVVAKVEALLVGGDWSPVIGALLGGLAVVLHELLTTVQDHGLRPSQHPPLLR